MQALHEEVKVTSPFVAKSRNTANTLYNDLAIGSAVGIDTKEHDEALVIAQLGAVGATTLDISLGFADVDDAEDASFTLLPSGAFAQVVDADDNKSFVIRARVKDLKRYMFVKVVQADAVAVLYSVLVLLSKSDSVPVTQEQTVAFTHETA